MVSLHCLGNVFAASDVYKCIEWHMHLEIVVPGTDAFSQKSFLVTLSFPQIFSLAK